MQGDRVCKAKSRSEGSRGGPTACEVPAVQAYRYP